MGGIQNGIIPAVAVVVAIAGSIVALAAEPAALLASPEAGWPQWRGPRRDGVATETGLLQTWPEGGPKLLWTAADLGTGWSSPIIAGAPGVPGEPRTIYITGDVGAELRIFALDLDGKPQWQATNGRAWKGQYPGARACGAYAGGRVYHSNAHGRVACFDAASGKELWAVETLERFAGEELTWGRAECLLVDGEHVIVTPGGRKAFMAALDAKTGQTVWASPPLDDPDTQRSGYGSPILFRYASRRIIATLALRALVGVDADTGRVLFNYPRSTKYDAPAATPVLAGDGLFYALPSGSGSVLLNLQPDAAGLRVEKAWEHAVDSCNGGAVCKDGFVYCSGYWNPAWYCLDTRTPRMGAEQAQWKGIAKGTLMYADGRLYCLSERGEVVLAKPAPQAFEVVGRFRVPAEVKGGDCWAHPVVLDGRLYLRYHEKLWCYAVRR